MVIKIAVFYFFWLFPFSNRMDVRLRLSLQTLFLYEYFREKWIRNSIYLKQKEGIRPINICRWERAQAEMGLASHMQGCPRVFYTRLSWSKVSLTKQDMFSSSWKTQLLPSTQFYLNPSFEWYSTVKGLFIDKQTFHYFLYE